MAPLIVSRTTGGPGAHARTGESAHSASKALSQRSIFRIGSFCRTMSGTPSVAHTGLPPAFAVTCAKQRTRNVSKLPSLVAAVLFCSALPARSQELPEGKGEEMVEAQCTSCHAFRAGGESEPTGWNTLGRLMTNHAAPSPQHEIATITEDLIKNVP